MTDSRAAQIWRLVAAEAAAREGQVGLPDLCAATASEIGVSGACVMAAAAGRPPHVMCVSGSVSEQLAESELTLGEGPCTDASVSLGPVLASDLADQKTIRRWPGFTGAARQLGAGAIFAFPLRYGAIRVGVLGLYRDRAVPLSPVQLGDALIFADTAVALLLASQSPARAGVVDGSLPLGQSPDLAVHRAEIDQATGMLTEQLGVGIADAFLRLRAYAYAEDRRLSDVARDIVARRLRLRPDSGDLPEGRP